MTALTTATESIAGLLSTDRLQSRWRSMPWVMIVTLLIVLASIGSSLSYTAREDASIDRQFEAKLSVYKQQADRISQMERLKHQETDLAAQAALDASLVDPIPRSRALAEVANALTAGIRLEDVSLGAAAQDGSELQTVDLETFNQPANVLRIKGIAFCDAQIGQFRAGLSRSAWLHGVHLSAAGHALAGGIGPRQFKITAIFDKRVDAAQRAERLK